MLHVMRLIKSAIWKMKTNFLKAYLDGITVFIINKDSARQQTETIQRSGDDGLYHCTTVTQFAALMSLEYLSCMSKLFIELNALFKHHYVRQFITCTLNNQQLQ